jgi:pimeloyl-ACP methyl ester carboxylesterase
VDFCELLGEGRHCSVTGGGRIQLHVVETGNQTGRPIVFIHGLSQCWLSWSRQLSSDLAGDHRLVAMDIRGHGLSEDAVVKRAAVDQHKAGMAHAQIHIVPNAGHAPVWDDAAAYNRRLREFSAGS